MKALKFFLIIIMTGSVFFVSSCEDEPGGKSAVKKCNGSEELCGKKYNEAAYAVTHNSMSNAEDGWFPPNQEYGIKKQLEYGIRGFMIDAWYLNMGSSDRGDESFLGNEAYMCHGSCSAYGGQEPLVNGLKDIADFMNTNPDEVITIIFESYIFAADIEAAFEEAGLASAAYTHAREGDWPTLGELTESGKNLVVFTDHDAGEPSWYMDVWAQCWEVHYSYSEASQLTAEGGYSCGVNRGADVFSNDELRPNSLFIFNHFITDIGEVAKAAAVINESGILQERALHCMEENSQLPNFITLDFYASGGILEVTEYLNGL